MPKTKRLRLLLLLILGAAVVLVLSYSDNLNVDVLRETIERAGFAAPLLFMLFYAIGAVVFLPGSALTLAGGAMFGPVWGTLYSLTGATVGAALAFAVARFLAADWVAQKAGGKLQRLVDGVEQEGWRFVAFTRLVPLFPFNILNYALGLTRISFAQYLIATYVFMLPGTVAYTWLGYVGAETAAGGEGLIQKGLIALALLAGVGFLPRFISRLRQKPWLEIDKLKENVDQKQVLVLDVRSPAEFCGEQGHIVGALNIPLGDLDTRIAELGGELQRPIAIVCHTDRRSAKAANFLTRRGFVNVRVARGGMTAWRDRGWPVEH